MFQERLDKPQAALTHTTSRHIESANIKDLSVLRMLENSMRDGILSQLSAPKALELLHSFRHAVKVYYATAWEAPQKRAVLHTALGLLAWVI